MVSWGNLADRLEQWASSKYALSAVNQFSTDLMKNYGVDAFFTRGGEEGNARDIVEFDTFLDTSQSCLTATGGGFLYSRRAFESPVFTMIAENAAIDRHIGFENVWGEEAGTMCYGINSDGTVDCEVWPTGVGNSLTFSPTDYYAWDISERTIYTILTRRASVEFWMNEGGVTTDEYLVGIIQTSPIGGETGFYTVRDDSPYFVGQVTRELPEPAKPIVGVDDDFSFKLWISDGGARRRPRHLQPITSNSRWEGTTIDSGTLTSDGIPCLGFDKVHVYFIADGSGTLDLNVDYGFNSYGQYDSITTSADSLENYIITGRVPWLQLEFTPDAYPTTVTRAMVVME